MLQGVLKGNWITEWHVKVLGIAQIEADFSAVTLAGGHLFYKHD